VKGATDVLIDLGTATAAGGALFTTLAVIAATILLWGLWYAFLSGPNRPGPRPGESQRS
jgi:hypothetical protein